MAQGFVDKDKARNARNGIEFYAAGLLTADYGPNASHKQFVVAYIDPWGYFNREVRSADEIELIEIAEDDADTLRCALKDAEAPSDSCYVTVVDEEFKVDLYRNEAAACAGLSSQELCFDLNERSRLATTTDIAKALSSNRPFWLYHSKQPQCKYRVTKHHHVRR